MNEGLVLIRVVGFLAGLVLGGLGMSLILDGEPAEAKAVGFTVAAMGVVLVLASVR